RRVRLLPRARRAVRRLRPGDGGAVRRDTDPHGAGAGHHAHRGALELVAGSARAEAGWREQRLKPLEPVSPDVPVPRRHALAGSRILQRLVLQPRRLHAQLASDGEQALLVGAHQMDHRLPAPPVPVKPNATVEGETHPLAAAFELLPGTGYVQLIRPSTVAVPTGGPAPKNRKHWRGVCACTAVAFQPPAETLTVRVTPVLGEKLFSIAMLVVYLTLS